MSESATRERMVTGAAQLLARAGLAEASFRNVVALTGAPRGSIYHHFPGGKDELVGASMRWVGGRLLGALRRTPVERPEDVVVVFAGLFRRLLVDAEPQDGCAVAAVTAAAPAGSAAAEEAAKVFAAWESELAAMLTRSGVADGRSTALATTVLAAVEGGLVLARARGDVRPFDVVVDQLLRLVTADTADVADGAGEFPPGV